MQLEGADDEGEVAERLGGVAELALCGRVPFLAQQPDVVAQREQALEQFDGILFTADLSQGAATAHLALNNAGSLASTDLLASVPTCTWSKTNNASPTFIALPGNCNGLYVTIQETDSSYTVPASDVYCAYGPSTSQPDCDAPNNTARLSDLSTPQQLLTSLGANATLTAGQTRYYVIKIDPTSVGTGNALQNLTATFDMRWHIDH